MSKAGIPFTFDGKPLLAEHGDTLAAALLRSGVQLVGRSFKYHRPRGILTAGVEEPSALVTAGEGGRSEANSRATDLFVYPGLVARSQNRWPSLRYDVGGVLNLLGAALPAGFYYKTFFGSASIWLFYERFIRKAAGLGNSPALPDPDRYAQRGAYCDVLVIGGGPAGIAAAKAAAEAGERVILAEQDAVLVPSLLRDGDRIGAAQAAADAGRIRALGGTVLTRTTGSGIWEHGLVTLTQRLCEPGQAPATGLAQRLWQVRARRVVLATGAIERPLPFANNDLPGVMLSQALRTYLGRFGVVPGRRVVIVTTGDDAYRTAWACREAGMEVVALLDSRSASAGPDLPDGTQRLQAAQPIAARGGKHRVTGLLARTGGTERLFGCDLIAVSGGFSPAVQLHMQAGGTLGYSEAAHSFLAADARQNVVCIGAAAEPVPSHTPPTLGDPKRCFVDFQNDVTLADIDLAHAEGYRSVEHLKRYTTLGMGTDQGKLGTMAALNRLAERQQVSVPIAGVTTYRPPYTPVTMGLWAGRSDRDAGAHCRRLPLHALHAARGALWQPLGLWHRPRAYPRGAESPSEAAWREARTVRSAIGLTDVSTLAKFEVAGPDARMLLETVCATRIALAEGRGRYTFMLRDDGMVSDDGTVWRIGPDRYLLTSSTGGAERMATVLSYARHVMHSALRVAVSDVQEHYAAFALAGPQASAALASLSGTMPPPHMGLARSAIAGMPVLILAASYSGERAFEIYCDGAQAQAVWAACEDAVEHRSGCRYGLDAMELLRIEKGHAVVGGEIDGRCTPNDLGLGSLLNPADCYIGAAGLRRPALSAPGRLQLVGLKGSAEAIPEGAMLLPRHNRPAQGHVTAAGRRLLGSEAIALALLKDGRARYGEEVLAFSPTRKQQAWVTVTAPLFHDPAGERYRD